MFWALITTMVAAGVGRLIGARVPSVAGRLVGSLIPVVLFLTVELVWPWLAWWEGSWLTVMLSLGIATAGIAAGVAARRLGQLGLMWAVVELAARVILPYPPSFPPGPSFTLRHEGQLYVSSAEACALMYSQLDHPAVANRLPDPKPTVLHVGDSMLQVGYLEKLPEHFQRADPERAHVNLGVMGAGPDVYLRLIRRFTHELDVRHVVVYLFPFNDLDDLSLRYPCCRTETLLDYNDPLLNAGCPDPNPPLFASATLDELILYAPGLYLWRMASTKSAFLAHLRGQAENLVRSPYTRDEVNEAELWSRLERIIAALSDELGRNDIGLTVVGMPVRDGFDPEGVHLATSQRIATLCARHRIDYLDVWQAIRQGDISTDAEWFYKFDGFHLDAHGHERVADWLAPQNLPGIEAPDE